MRVRPAEPADIPKLKEWYESSGLDYDLPDLNGPNIERIYVAECDGRIVAAVAAEKILQLYFLSDSGLHPAAKLAALKEFHDFMTLDLRARGWREVNAFVPPHMEKSFGKRLRSLGWFKAWPSFCKRF